MAADLAEKYEILGEIGSGGFSRVYKAVHRKLGREVAIKILDGVNEFEDLALSAEDSPTAIALLD